jgi:hypothetical protein
LNFIVNQMDPVYTTIDASTTFTIFAGYDAADVVARVKTALTNYLSPANWGKPTTGDQHDWLNVTVVRYLELATLVNNVEGVDYITALYIGTGAHKTFTVVAATDTFTSTAHGYANGDPLGIVAVTGAAPLTLGQLVYVRDSVADTFKVTTTAGGAALNITSDGSGSVQRLASSNITLAGVAPLPQPGVIGAAVG